MDAFNYVRSKKLNGFYETWPGSPRDVTLGPTPQIFQGLLGAEFKLSKASANKYSDSAVRTLQQGVYKIVRVNPGITNTQWVVGRPLFWVDEAAAVPTVTPVATTLVRQAGVAINTMSAADALNGCITLIQISGVAPGLGRGTAFTKATPALNDPVVLSIAASLATLDVLADATGWTNVEKKLEIGRVYEAMVLDTVKNFILTNSIPFNIDGIK